ncbi:MAG: 1-deoxy-D-xylulose-5-phosphate reductoisomerase [Parvibaculales bacterium]
MRRLAIFGATGTIGDNALVLVARHPQRFSVSVLTAHSNVEKLAALAKQFQPDVLVIGDEAGRSRLVESLPAFTGEILVGEEGLLAAAAYEVDVTVLGIVGFAGLKPALASAARGGILALANKEALVAAGPLLMQIAADNGCQILPVDSEHNAIYQLLQDGRVSDKVDKIVLTASGGPFRTLSKAEMATVTPQQAVAHPNWDMGAKISVDSATLMNKGLELIEARYLFDVAPQRLDVLVHRQSIVHGLVYFNDGSVLAQKGSPDMRVPLAYCMAYPDRIATGVPPLDLAAQGRLDFEAADRDRFPCLALAEAAMQAGGARPTVLNAANEIAVAAFLAGRIGFAAIAEIVEAVLQADFDTAADTVEAIFAADEKARQLAKKMAEN